MILPALPALIACGLITQQVQLSKVAVVPPPFLPSEKSKDDTRNHRQERKQIKN